MLVMALVCALCLLPSLRSHGFMPTGQQYPSMNGECVKRGDTIPAVGGPRDILQPPPTGISSGQIKRDREGERANIIPGQLQIVNE